MVSITERGGGFDEKVLIKVLSVRWLVENLKLVAMLPEVDKLVRTGDEGDRILVGYNAQTFVVDLWKSHCFLEMG